MDLDGAWGNAIGIRWRLPSLNYLICVSSLALIYRVILAKLQVKLSS